MSTLSVALIQMSPILLDRVGTLSKMCTKAEDAGKQGAQLALFGEAMLPGYPFWIEHTDGAKFNSTIQKEIHAKYLQEAIQPEAGDLQPLQKIAQQYKMQMVVGAIERAADRGGHSLYCSMIHIDALGKIINVHRKLMPTYEERMSWSPGDAHGLRTNEVGPFTLGALNCWENWMPMPRTALYAQGENLHVALWPGNVRNTEILTRFLAQEGRSFVISICGLFGKNDIPDDFPHRDLFYKNAPDTMADGGSCIAAPTGEWLLEPQAKTENTFYASLDFSRVLEERQNFDPVGHYSRPDIFTLQVDRQRRTGFLLDG